MDVRHNFKRRSQAYVPTSDEPTTVYSENNPFLTYAYARKHFGIAAAVM